MKVIFPIDTVIASSNVAASAYANWSNTTAYSIGNKVYLPSNFGEYEAKTANTGKDPSLNPLDWKFLGTANKYKMFDQFLNTKTTNTGTITVQLVAYGSQAVYIGNIDAITVTIQVIDNDTLSVIETHTESMYSPISNWMDYFYGDWIDNRKTSLTYERTTLTRNVSIAITVDNGAGIAGCGIFTTGLLKQIGVTKYGISLGALDYSAVSTNTDSGATYLQKGNYAKEVKVDLFANSSQVPAIFKILTDARATPLVFIPGGDETYTVYGYVRQHETIVSGPVETAISADIIGLI